jgi:hypothetical protein
MDDFGYQKDQPARVTVFITESPTLDVKLRRRHLSAQRSPFQYHLCSRLRRAGRTGIPARLRKTERTIQKRYPRYVSYLQTVATFDVAH